MRRLALVAAGLVLLVGLAAGFRVLQAGRDLRSAERLLNSAGESVEQGRVADAIDQLTQATNRLSSAAKALDGHPEVSLLKRVPILGDNLKAIRRSTALATQVSAGGIDVLRAAQPLARADGTLEVPLRAGTVPLSVIQAVQGQVDRLAASLPNDEELDEAPGLLLGPVSTMHHKVNDEVRNRRDQLDVLADGLAVLADMAGGSGPRAYLIAVSNSAEMRGSGGMVLSYGALLSSNGSFQLLDFERIDALALSRTIERSEVPNLPSDYLRRWDGFDPLRLWRNANLGADFPMVAPVLEAMGRVGGGGRVDGVIQIDPVGLAAILEAVGPVEVPELGSVGADNLVETVLYDAYVRYEGIEERSDVLRTVAEAAFTKLLTGQYDSLRSLADALVSATQGRHVMFHSIDPATQMRVAALGADGALPPLDGPDAVSLTVQNVSANKLDYFVDTEVALSGDISPARPGRVRAEVLVHNGAPAGVTTPKYVYGPFNRDQQAGVYRGVVSLYLPRGATLVSASGDAPRDPPIEVSEGGRPVISWTVDLPAGATSHVVLDLTWAPRPEGDYELVAIPSPRVRPTALRVDLATGGDPFEAQVTLDRTWRLRPGKPPEEVLGPVTPPLEAVGG